MRALLLQLRMTCAIAAEAGLLNHAPTLSLLGICPACLQVLPLGTGMPSALDSFRVRMPGANAGCENEKWSFLLALVYRLLTIVILTHVKRILRLLRESIVPIHNLSHDLMRVNSMMRMYCYFNERCLPSALSPYLCKAMSEETIGDKCSW